MSVTQWMAGFGRAMRDEPDPEIRQHMLEYMISLMDDTIEFSWDFGQSQPRSVFVSNGARRG